MLFLFTFLFMPFIDQDCGIKDATYVQESIDCEEDEEKDQYSKEDDEVMPISHKSDNSFGGGMKISSKKYMYRGCKKNPKKKEEENISCDDSIRKDFADTRIIQLVSDISEDLGMVTKVSLIK
ncbi:MAG: hypothetical protein LBI95_00135 [Holosporales bacterium]|jgi:hypothetical protein|nr:hypothetical protein [Holosporales bacterium]